MVKKRTSTTNQKFSTKTDVSDDDESTPKPKAGTTDCGAKSKMALNYFENDNNHKKQKIKSYIAA
jgi:hypothetical protein